MADRDVVIVGAGLAGLCAALELQANDVPYRIVEASDAVGGRVRTDVVDGFRLDRGFQVLLEAYPEARRVLDYDALDLRSFYPGALVRHAGSFRRLADPLRRPLDAVRSLFEGIGSVGDKLTMLSLRKRAREGGLDDVFARPETTSAAALESLGFSPSMTDTFLRPWLGGVFLERDLATSSRMLDFVIRMFAEGPTSIPANGMGEIPRQIAGRLDPSRIHLGSRADRVTPDAVTLDNGDSLDADAVIVATEGPAAARLLGHDAPPPAHQVSCLCFAADQDPVGEAILVLDGEGDGPVNNLVVPSALSAAYAPPGQALVSASVVGETTDDDAALEAAVRDQLRDWFGSAVATWNHIRTYRIPYALPNADSGIDLGARDTRVSRGLHVCGDHREMGSIQGAMRSGRRAAEAVLADLGAAAEVA